MGYTLAGLYTGVAQNTAGIPLPRGSVVVYAMGTTTLAPLFTSAAKTTSASNPVTADSLGNFTFYAGPGLYDLVNSGVTVTVEVSPHPSDLSSTADTTSTLALRAPDWITGRAYIVGELVTNAGTLYRTTTAHTSGATFDGTKFTAIGGGGGGGAQVGKGVVSGPGAVAGANFAAATPIPSSVSVFDTYSGQLVVNTVVTLPAPSIGANFLLRMVQDATGSRTVSFATPSGTITYPVGAPIIIPTPGAVNEVQCCSPDGANWELLSITDVSSTALPIIENVNVVGAAGAAQTVPDVTTQTISRYALTVATLTLTFPALPVATLTKTFTVITVQDATGGRLVTWPASVLWAGGVTPTLTAAANKRDVFVFQSDNALNWLGSVAGQAF